MTEDPVKLYVVVMAILLCVLAFVAWKSKSEADAFERAIREAPNLARQLKENASEVQGLCSQLAKSKLRKGHLSLIEEASRDNRVEYVSLKPQRDERLPGGVGKEKSWRFEFRKSGRSRYLTREEIARFCRTVEMYSQNVLKTIEIQLFRVTEPGTPAPGKEDEVVGDLYRGQLVFGLRTVD